MGLRAQPPATWSHPAAPSCLEAGMFHGASGNGSCSVLDTMPLVVPELPSSGCTGLPPPPRPAASP